MEKSQKENKMQRYVIHACPNRMWYVEEYLIPSMVKQGIPETEIRIWNDEDGKGNLMSSMECFEECGKHKGGCWHLQDDVIIAGDFAGRTKEDGAEVICGFCHFNFESKDISKGLGVDKIGRVKVEDMWNSFPCIYVPNSIAADFAEWFFKRAMYRPHYERHIRERKHDDMFFRDYMRECHENETVINLVPALVDHIDWLLGGSVVNPMRGTNSRAYHWKDERMIEKLKNNLRKGAHRNGVLF